MLRPQLAVAIDGVEGWLTDEQADMLWRYARVGPFAGTIVEIGSYCGRSSICLALGAATRQARVYCIDPWTWVPEAMTSFRHITRNDMRSSYERFLANIRRAGVEQWITPVPGLSHEVVGRIPSFVDLLFIDGDHTYDGVRRDWDLYTPKLTMSGCVMLHDTEPTRFGVHQLVQDLADDPRWAIAETVPNAIMYRRA